MAAWLKQSTAVEIKLGPFLDSTDGNTAETGLTIEDEHVDLAKNGGDWGDKAETTTCVHESQGWYRCLLDTTDTNTLGILIVKSHVTGALAVWREFMVLPAQVYDSLVSTDLLQVDTREVTGTAQTAGDLAALVTTVDTVVDAVLVDTAEIGAAGAGLTAINLPNQTMDIVGNITGNLSGSVGSVTGAVGSVTGAVGSVTALAANSVSASALATDAVTEIADGILDRNMATGTDSGSTTVRTMRQALRFLRNKWSISGTTLTVTKEDDSTASWTSEVTATAGADPITANDPAGP